jgi:hypothetical protein
MHSNAQQGFYIKTNYVGREQYNRDRKKESVRDSELLEMRDSIGNENRLLEKTFVTDVGLI